MLFKDIDGVLVIDSKCAVGGMRIIVDEINKYHNSLSLGTKRLWVYIRLKKII